MTLRDEIAALMAEKQITTYRISKLTGINTSQIYRLLSGAPRGGLSLRRVENIRDLLRALCPVRSNEG